MIDKTPITVAYGDGVGPEIMSATLKILKAANAAIEPEIIEIGEKVYREGNRLGITSEAFESLRKTKILLKAPIDTPKNSNYQTLNHTLRKLLGIYANVRVNKALSPYVPTHHPDMDVVLIREFSEGLYVGIEHRQTQDAYQALKLVTRSGSERIIRYAFEYAKKFHRKKISCFSKDNIMQMTDGLFCKVFNEIALEYPEIATNHFLIDDGAAIFADDPVQFDVIVSENLYADILSDIAAKLVGSVSVSGSTNIGEELAVFEPCHGPAVDIAGQRVANPSGMLNAAIQMLVYLKQFDCAALIENAWLKTIEDGYHTVDIYRMDYSEKQLTTDEFADAVIERLGQKASKFSEVTYNIEEDDHRSSITEDTLPVYQEKRLVGVDVFLDLPLCGPEALADYLNKYLESKLALKAITHRDTLIWPDGFILSNHYCADCWRCRFQGGKEFKKVILHEDVIQLLTSLNQLGFDVIKTENLYTYDGQLGFSSVS